MRVRVKQISEGFYGIYGNERRYAVNKRGEADDFELVDRKTTKKDINGKPVILKAKDQFSEKWMELISEPKKRGRKPKEAEEELAEEGVE